MKRPENLDFGPVPDVEELRDAAQNLVRIASELFGVAGWIDRGKNYSSIYWSRVEKLQEELNHSAKSFSHGGEE